MKINRAAKLLLLLICLILPVSGPSWASEDNSLQEFFAELPESPAKDALNQMPDMGRKLLALRSYSRAGRTLARRWSWTEEQIKAYQGSEEQTALLAEVEAISTHFAETNPGYEIYARTQVRSLDLQIKRWNRNESVGLAGDEIYASWIEMFGSTEGKPRKWKAKAFWRWLNSFRGNTRARLAAPGLSRHGQARAIDFQIKKDGQIIAGTSSRKIADTWRAEKWDEKLKASVEAAGPSFKGPLVRPDEPWHYDYYPGGIPKKFN